jgi:lipoyl(octanoyl) transferase
MQNNRRRKPDAAPEPVFRVYLLGLVDFDTVLSFQRRLVYDAWSDRAVATLILCEHPALVSVGRQGSWAHIDRGIEQYRSGRLPVRWVNRGGGSILHTPGQLAIYPILALDRHELSIQGYLDRFRVALLALLGDFSIKGIVRPGHSGVCVGDRPIAEIGIAVRHWVTYFGAALNVNPDLRLFRHVSSGVAGCRDMTSIERERHGPLRPSLVREHLIEHVAREFGFGQPLLFTDHPSLKLKVRCDALAPHR